MKQVVFWAPPARRWHTSICHTTPRSSHSSYSSSLPSSSPVLAFDSNRIPVLIGLRGQSDDDRRGGRTASDGARPLPRTSSPRTLCESHLRCVRAWGTGERECIIGVARMPAMPTPSAINKPMFLQSSIISLHFYKTRSSEPGMYSTILALVHNQNQNSNTRLKCWIEIY